MTTVGFWYGLALGVFAGIALCVVGILAVMVWFDWRDGIELSMPGEDE